MKKLLPLLCLLLVGCVPPVVHAGTSNVTVNNLTGSLNMGQMGSGVELGFSVPTGYTLRFKSGSTLAIDAGATLSGVTFIVNGGLTGNGFVIASGSNAIISTAAATDGQILVGRTGLPPLKTSLQATANQTTVTGGAGTLQVGTVQDIGTTSVPVFGGLTVQGASPAFSVNDAGTSFAYGTFSSNGLAERLRIGQENAVGGSLLSGSSAYAGVLFTHGNRPLQIGVNDTIVGSFTSTGLNGAAIGATTPSTGHFTTIASDTLVTISSDSNANALFLLGRPADDIAQIQFKDHTNAAITSLIGTDGSGNLYFGTGPSAITGLFITSAQKVKVAVGVSADGGGFKHARTSTGSVSATSTALVTVTWGTPFADANYTASAQVLEATASSLALSVVHIESQTAAALTVRVSNTSAGALTGTIHCIAVHD